MQQVIYKSASELAHLIRTRQATSTEIPFRTERSGSSAPQSDCRAARNPQSAHPDLSFRTERFGSSPCRVTAAQ